MEEPLLPRSFWTDMAQRGLDLEAARFRLDLQEKAWNLMVRRWPADTPYGPAPPLSPQWVPGGIVAPEGNPGKTQGP